MVLKLFMMNGHWFVSHNPFVFSTYHFSQGSFFAFIFFSAFCVTTVLLQILKFGVYVGWFFFFFLAGIFRILARKEGGMVQSTGM